MNTVSSVGSATRQVDELEPAALGGGHDARDDPLGALDVQFDAAVDHPRPRHPFDAVLERLCKRGPLAVEP